MASELSTFSGVALSDKNQLIAVGASLATNTITTAISSFSDLRKHRVEHPNDGVTSNTGCRAPISFGFINVVGPTIDNRTLVEKKQGDG